MDAQTTRSEERLAVLARHLAVVDGSSLDQESRPVPLPLQEQRVGADLAVQRAALDEEAAFLEAQTKRARQND